MNTSTNNHTKKRTEHIIVLYRNNLALLSKQSCFSFKDLKPWNVREHSACSVFKAEKNCSLHTWLFLWYFELLGSDTIADT